jgi:predicted phage baseplate assembly protein
MPLTAPNLDDLTFEQIVAQAKLLIPRYAPSWTNQSDADPGITLMQLFAWMTEMMVFRLNQVPELNYIKFLQLLGIELTAAQPAQADVTFTTSRNDIAGVNVPAGTQIAASGGAGSSPIVFETTEDILAISGTLASIQVFDGFSYQAVTTANGAAGQWYYPFGPNGNAGSALMLGFDSPIAFPSDQINLAVYLFTSPTRPDPQHCGIDQSGLPTAGALAWEFYDGSFWQALSLDKDTTRTFTQNGHIYFDGPGITIQKAALGTVKQKYYWLRARLVTNGYDAQPRIAQIVTNTVSAIQGQTANDEILGGSTGLPDQVFQLANKPVIVSVKPTKVTGADGLQVSVLSAQIAVDEGAGPLAWQEVSDFYASGPDDPHFTLDYTTGTVTFGNGTHGRIPVANPAAASSNIVAVTYRHGGGSQGNAGPKTITALLTSIDGIASVINLSGATGGTDEETLDDAKLRAPRQLQSKGRAVTATDFELIATETPGVDVRRAFAMPLTHPQFGSPIPGVVTVVVVPYSTAPNPMPGSATLAAVCAELNAHRLLTSEVYVVAPTYRLISIQAQIVVNSNADLSETKAAVEAALTTYFDPLRGGDAKTGWPFGGPIYYSNVYRVILDVPGVSRIQDNNMVIWLGNLAQQFCRDVPINPGELAYSNGHQISVTYGA